MKSVMKETKHFTLGGAKASFSRLERGLNVKIKRKKNVFQTRGMDILDRELQGQRNRVERPPNLQSSNIFEGNRLHS